MGQQVVRASEGARYNWSNDRIVVKAVSSLSEGGATLIEDTLKPGFQLARHQHRRMTEIFYVLQGAVEFTFDDEVITAEAGTTVTIPPLTWHEVTCEAGGRLLTVFSPGGFEDYLSALAALTPAQAADDAVLAELAERHDIWTAEPPSRLARGS